MSNTLTGVSPASTRQQLLHIGTGSLAANSPVRLGDGSATKLSLHTGGIGVDGIKLSRAAGSAEREVVFPDHAGTVGLHIEAVKTSDQTNDTVTAAAITALSATLAASSIYEFEAILLCKSAATTTGVQLRVMGPTSETEFVCYDITQLTTNTLVTTNTRRQYFIAFDTNMANLDAPAANSLFPVFIKGILKTTGSTPAVPLSFQFNSEVASSLVTIAAGSLLRVRKIA